MPKEHSTKRYEAAAKLRDYIADPGARGSLGVVTAIIDAAREGVEPDELKAPPLRLEVMPDEWGCKVVALDWGTERYTMRLAEEVFERLLRAARSGRIEVV